VTYPFSTPSCFLSAPAVEEKQPSRVLSPEEWARVLPVKKKSNQVLQFTGLLKIYGWSSPAHLRRTICPAPQESLT